VAVLHSRWGSSAAALHPWIPVVGVPIPVQDAVVHAEHFRRVVAGFSAALFAPRCLAFHPYGPRSNDPCRGHQGSHPDGVAGGKFLLENLLPAGQIAALFRLGRFGLGSCCSPGRSGGGTGGNEPQDDGGKGYMQEHWQAPGALGGGAPSIGYPHEVSGA
jgi:hypothetical protein